MHKLIALLVALTCPLLVGTSCGDDDDPADSTSTTASESTATTSSSTEGPIDGDAFPSAEFCAAQADMATAQDGAQRNTAIGEMQEALPDDAPPAIDEALTTLLTGDLATEAYAAAESALADACA